MSIFSHFFKQVSFTQINKKETFSFDEEEYYTEETYLEDHIDTETKMFSCPNCQHKTHEKKLKDKWICKCKTPLSIWSTSLSIYNPNRLIEEEPEPEDYSILALFPEKANVQYDVESHVSDHTIDVLEESQLITGMNICVEKFVCPCCSIIYNRIEHGNTWKCSCDAIFVSYGNFLEYKSSHIVKMQKKLSGFYE